ncbi:GNAT family N-acetyltransferase [Ancylobacter defluvii]|uniref:Ribosomal-protein-alanine N-acetyltransferase n=1 Tax=Ancylobacter defluvii TaxID=1282440 RepID=A0A9W6JYQ8_9HYPH|nr:GNAT family protein [Ancylobacter defluvii]MBS7589396.1 GNAT family N-acetyltransferase [Ancylobacter defluvii]GLK85011.1 ribosomal-protein-alanine N-acetyltransferase [Ancylobacter defluvii]
MALFRSVSWPEPPSLIEGEGVILRVPQMSDFAAWATLREESRSFLAPWEPLWPAHDLTRGAFRRRMRRYARDLKEDNAYPFLVLRAADRVLLGGLSLSNVRRGVTQTANLGYWMGAPFAGKGHMTAAVRALLPYAHGTLGLRRIEAACLPSNQPSIRLLQRVGFRREGYGREYLCINGVWQDHLLFGRLSSDPVAPAPTPARPTLVRDADEERHG